MSLIEKIMSQAKLIRRSAEVSGGRRSETLTEVKTVLATAVVKKASKAICGETYSPVTEYAVFTPTGIGLEYYDILQFEDGKSLLITSNRAVCTPEGSAMSYERYSAEERTD